MLARCPPLFGAASVGGGQGRDLIGDFGPSLALPFVSTSAGSSSFFCTTSTCSIVAPRRNSWAGSLAPWLWVVSPAPSLQGCWPGVSDCERRCCCASRRFRYWRRCAL